MSEQYTQGPWRAHRERHGLFVSAGSFCIAQLGDGFAAGQEANARLIAASPDQHAALTVLLDVCTRMELEDAGLRPTEREYHAALAVAREAIAQVKGCVA